MNDDWIDFLRELLDARARFLVGGAHALAVHGVPRATQDLDVWIDRTPDNAVAVARALASFGTPIDALRTDLADLQRADQVIQIGVAPNRIDILTSISGVPDFSQAWDSRIEHPVRGRDIPFMGRDQLIQSKRATGWNKDLGDLEMLGAL